MQCTTRKTCFVDANIIFSNTFESVVVFVFLFISIIRLISQWFLFQNKWGAKRLGCFFSETPVISYVSPLELRKRSQQCSQISQNQKVFKTQNEPKHLSSNWAETQLFELFYQHRLYSSVCQQLTWFNWCVSIFLRKFRRKITKSAYKKINLQIRSCIRGLKICIFA